MIKRAPVLTSALVFALSASAQTTTQATTPNHQTTPAATPADPPMPKDPNALMQLAARVNGLGSPDMKPWHLKANYQTFDADGKPKEQGVFEEWWASPDKYKISYTSTSFNQVQYHDGGKEWITGDKGWPSLPEAMVQHFLVHPLPPADLLQKQSFSRSDKRMGNVTLNCLQPSKESSTLPATPGMMLVEQQQSFALDPASGFKSTPTTCFARTDPMVRVEVFHGGWFTVLNDEVEANDIHIAKDIWVKNANLSILHVSVLGLDLSAALPESQFTPPEAATTVPLQQAQDNVVPPHRISGRETEYPSGARSQRIQGMIMLQAIVSKDGDIDNLQLISGPKLLQQTALDAVKTWKFKPFLLNGQPVAVSTKITIFFQLGR